ncbi:MAG: ATP-binding protein [Candidatus Cloacimonetes bacterium]|nr:ATP-binding protein [Candidatus Cloacimonadota bacterium]
MKSHILVQTKNVTRGMECMQYLQGRPLDHQVGMAMIYGRPGLGKTQFSMRYAIQHRSVYLSALKAATPKSFTVELLRAIRALYEPENTTRITGNKARLFGEILDTLNRNTTKDHLPVLLIDEVDNIIHYQHEGIIGMLRDIADNTVSSVVLVGMQDLRDKVAKLNTHYYNRFIYFAEFKALDNQDAILMCKQLSDVEIAEDLARYSNDRRRAGGDARKLIKAIRLYEDIAAQLNIQTIDLKQYLKIIGE